MKWEYESAFCRAMLSFFAVSYRKGIEDAIRCDDEAQCMEVSERLKHPAAFATLEHPDLDWCEWQFKVIRWTREHPCRKRLMDLLLSMRSPKHPKAFILQIAKMFYRNGLRDWAGCSDWLTRDALASLPTHPYLLMGKRSFRSSTMRERFEQLQCVALSMVKIHDGFRFSDSELEAYRIPRMRFSKFVERIWSAMQREKWFDMDDGDSD